MSICGVFTVPTLTCPVKIIYVFGLVRLVSVTAWGAGENAIRRGGCGSEYLSVRTFSQRINNETRIWPLRVVAGSEVVGGSISWHPSKNV